MANRELDLGAPSRDISLGVTLALAAFATFYSIAAVHALATLGLGYAFVSGVLPPAAAQVVLPLLALAEVLAKAAVLHWIVRRAPERLAGGDGPGSWPTTLAVLGGISLFISLGISTVSPALFSRLGGPALLGSWMLIAGTVRLFSQLSHGGLVVAFLLYAAQRWHRYSSAAQPR